MIKVANWSKYQSYKDRKPPWIRFHRSILDDYQFQSMSADARATLPMLWLLACEDNDPTSGFIQCSINEIAFRLRQTESALAVIFKELEVAGFIECNETVTKPLRVSNQTVTPETETETETETDIRVCPHQKIIKLYNDILGETLTRVRPSLWTGSRKTNLKTRWNEFEERQSIDWWKRFFYSVKETPFLCGNSNGGWKADMGWIIKKENMIKIIEGKYKSGNDKDSPDWEKYCKN